MMLRPNSNVSVKNLSIHRGLQGALQNLGTGTFLARLEGQGESNTYQEDGIANNMIKKEKQKVFLGANRRQQEDWIECF